MERMRHALVAALILLAGTSAQTTGDAGCKCIDPWTRNLTINGAVLSASSSCPWKATDGTCYPVTYGRSTCTTHDLTLSAACTAAGRDPADEATQWCEASWCWVDADACLRPTSTSAYFPNALVDNEQPLSYSYATCGNLNYYARGEQELRNLPRIRVSWADIDSSTGYTKVNAPAGEEGVEDSLGTKTGVTGAVVKFMVDLFTFYGIEWQFVPISAESMSYSASAVTNCIHEVAINRTDMCWFDSWLTEPRLQLTTMVALFEDTFKVMVRKAGEETLSIPSMLAVPFLPFKLELWVVIIGQYIVCSLVMFLIEGSSNDDDFPDSSVRGGVVESVYKGFFAGFGGGLLLNPKTVPGKIIVTGLSLSVMVFMSIYGAQVTTALVESRLGAPTGTISSFEEGLERGATFCVYSFTVPFVKARWPNMKVLAVGAGGKVYEMFDALYEGKCDASLIIDNWWRNAQAGGYSDAKSPLFDTVYSQHLKGVEDDGWKRFHCDDKIFPIASIGVPWSIGNGIPVREELVRLIRFAIKKAQDDSTRRYSTYAAAFSEKFVEPAAGCSAQGASSADGGEVDVSASLQDGVGATMVSLIFTAAALIFWGVENALSSRAPKSTKSEPEEAEVGVDMGKVETFAAEADGLAQARIDQRLGAIEAALGALAAGKAQGSNDRDAPPPQGSEDRVAPPPRRSDLTGDVVFSMSTTP